MDESPRWLFMHNCYKEAEAILRKIAAINHTELPDEFDVTSIQKVLYLF